MNGYCSKKETNIYIVYTYTLLDIYVSLTSLYSSMDLINLITIIINALQLLRQVLNNFGINFLIGQNDEESTQIIHSETQTESSTTFETETQNPPLPIFVRNRDFTPIARVDAFRDSPSPAVVVENVETSVYWNWESND